jgi:hypothetical protein
LSICDLSDVSPVNALPKSIKAWRTHRGPFNPGFVLGLTVLSMVH